jgi:hypothetical protein
MNTTSPIRRSWSLTYFQTVGKHLLATVVMTSYGFQFGSSTTPWKDHQVYFETNPALSGYLNRVGHNHWFLYRDVFCQRWVCSHMLLLMILRIDCYLIMLWWLGTMEEIRKGLKRYVEVQRSSKGGQAKLESQSKSSWNPIRIPGTVRTKFVTQITYQLRFGRSLYRWKDKRINFPMELVSYPYSFWVQGKSWNNEVHRICHGVVLPYLGHVGYVSSWAQ